MVIFQRNNVHDLGGDGPTLIYGHGFGCNQTMWDRITPAFAATHRQVLFDYVGSGRSDLASFDKKKYANLHGYALDLLAVCDAVGVTQGAVFVGHSVSCSIGMLAAIARPGLFDRMILVGPSPCFLNHPPEYLGGFEREDLEGLLSLMEQNYIGWANYLAPVVSGPQGEGSGHETATLTDSFCSTDPTAARIFAQATFFADNRADVPRVPCPCLVLQHRHDTLAPLSVGAYLQAHLAHGTLEILDVTGHCGHMSHPELVIEAMRGYLATPAR